MLRTAGVLTRTSLLAALVIGLGAGACSPKPPDVAQAEARTQLAQHETFIAAPEASAPILAGSDSPAAKDALAKLAASKAANDKLAADNQKLADELAAQAAAKSGNPPTAGTPEAWSDIALGFLPEPYRAPIAGVVGLGIGIWRSLKVQSAAKNVVASTEFARSRDAALNAAMSSPEVVALLNAYQTAEAKKLVDAGQEAARKADAALPKPTPKAA